MVEPRTVRQVMQTDEWRDAMEKEFSALVTNKTWVFVPPIKTQNIVGNK